MELEEVGALFFVATTGISTPSLDAKLLFELRLSPNLKRVPVWVWDALAGLPGWRGRRTTLGRTLGSSC